MKTTSLTSSTLHYKKNLNQPLKPFELFRVFIYRIKDAVDIVKVAHCPFTSQQILNKILTSMIKVQALLEVAICEWRNKLNTDKTWANFKCYFSKKIKD